MPDNTDHASALVAAAGDMSRPSPEAMGVTVDPSIEDLWPRRGPVFAGAEDAARRALEAANLPPEQVGGLVWITTAGIRAMEGAPQWLHWRLGLPKEAGFWFTGGSGVVDALNALVLCGVPGSPSPVDAPVLLVAAELAASVPADPILSDHYGMGATDGVAAAVLGGRPPADQAPILAGWHRNIWPREEAQDGDASGFVARRLGASVAEGCRKLGWNPEDLAHFLVHPGARDAVEAAEYSLAEAVGRNVGLPDTRQVFGRGGDAAGASLLAMVENLARRAEPDGRPGVVSAVATNSIEHAFFVYGSPR